MIAGENNKAAVVVGIDHYSQPNMLYGCVADAQNVADCLAAHENRARNMQVTPLLSGVSADVTADRIMDAIEELFQSTLSCAVIYLAGHSVYKPNSSDLVLVTPEGEKKSRGVSLQEIMNLANDAFPRVQSTVIILDTCHSGALGENRISNSASATSTLGEGVTILAASGRKQRAGERNAGGIFTSLMLEALKGGAADLLGRVTPAAVYSFVDQNFGAVGQRPVYKANVSRFTSLRQCEPPIDIEHLKNLPKWFPENAANPDMQDQHALDERYEPNRDNVPKELMDIPPDPKLTMIFEGLQACNRQGLVVPVGAAHMYYAAIERKSCALTPLGRHYRNLVVRGELGV
ncbi:Caspase domain protein [Pelagimonas phthalicica]|uniref:Caspase domain protein n=1 Tax=Pelagimonas phthalicica TaxID=1037362 RepID=A0A238JBY8_9RHOB|nr:caspase family protein [Pelagimonas phthalicica]TDS91163.1 caspase domain-containing protein [Pelagimonas phthalicica]SMX28210.1 Caspase domain protein [Pelagimonas phthalicica]